MAAASHLKVDVAAAVAGEAGPLQRHHLLLVGVADGEARQARVPVLVDVADGGAWWRLDLQLSVTRNTEEEEEYESPVIMAHITLPPGFIPVYDAAHNQGCVTSLVSLLRFCVTNVTSGHQNKTMRVYCQLWRSATCKEKANGAGAEENIFFSEKWLRCAVARSE